jgi:hypothetical protein
LLLLAAAAVQAMDLRSLLVAEVIQKGLVAEPVVLWRTQTTFQ